MTGSLSNAERPAVTRLAPSPTGALHLGNARTFLINWAMARRARWRIVLRIEDLDGPRVKPEAAAQAIEMLAWLGMDWDDGPLYQSANLSPYRDALAMLGRRRLIYPCTCTRKEVERAQSAPHGAEGEPRYPGTCRANLGQAFGDERAAAWRVVVPDEPIRFHDRLHGEQAANVQAGVGDFIVATRAGLAAYQLAVVVDDARQGVTQVVRGDDLLDSTARQGWLHRMLELGDPPRYTHLPLVVGPDGRRLAKRHGDTRLAAYRERGVSPRRIIGLLAQWSGLSAERTEWAADEFAARFTLDRLPRHPIVLTPEDDAWLQG